MHNLFPDHNLHLDLPQSDIRYFSNIITEAEALTLFKRLRETIAWQQDNITVFGKTHPQPRLTALYATNSKPYSYSNIIMHPIPFTAELLRLKLTVEALSKTTFTSCLLNLYRDGKDSNGWHSDDEKELGKNPVIASVSLGAERIFHLKNKHNNNLKHKVLLENGSLLLMQGKTQHHWLHQIPKTTKPIGERINLTFRTIL
ncbi:alpha-ketoglutarate-dependent dioxygenase AlkB [Cellulophaga sp. F20128]|uniref:alpha-ketoglutarate-dependent dioxygenase AlkB family protein n=1 Tax=Cellulophaga sp. F20128 TaxID=2926413 RepID=UPI001FF35E12|nr:alpha-ketoglutarate-dependent dioxygenase AlkB [Cellulophaga sp. F20128]MCK0158378.1 alpha-ketoglutarate-dependent dioxygenase AlkB [Cellulophaga sp. F20128]